MSVSPIPRVIAISDDFTESSPEGTYDVYECSGTITLILKSPANRRRKVTVINTDTGVITIQTEGTDATIDGETSATLANQYEAMAYIANGRTGSDAMWRSEVNGAVGTLPVKATGAEITTGTNDAKFATAKALRDAQVPVGITATAAQLNQAGAGAAGVAFDRSPKVVIKALSGAAIHAAVVNWQNPEAVSIIIKRIIIDVTTPATSAASLDAGTTSVGATTASDNLIDGIDVHTAAGLFSTLDGDATNAKQQQKLAAAKWVTFKEISGDITGLVANAYIEYVLI